MVLLPPFTPQAIEKLRPKARAICNELIDTFADKPGCDAAVDYAQHIPVRVIAAMLGIPESDGDQFRKWIHEILEVGTTDDELRDVIRTLQENEVTMVGASDHTVTHSLYILDPDGNEIELYIDVQPEVWREDPAAVLAPVKPLRL